MHCQALHWSTCRNLKRITSKHSQMKRVYTRLSFASMDPYLDAPESHSIPDEELDDDTLLQLEQDLAPKASDYYGVLNVSRTVRSCFLWRTIAAIHTTQCSRVMSGNRRRNQGCLQETLSILPSGQGKSDCSLQ